MLIFGCVDFPEIAGEFRKPPRFLWAMRFFMVKAFLPALKEIQVTQSHDSPWEQRGGVSQHSFERPVVGIF